jgi:hypothetical protein
LNRTVIGHGPVHGPATVRSGTGRTVRSISILYLQTTFMLMLVLKVNMV